MKLLSARELCALFPGAQVIRERVGGVRHHGLVIGRAGHLDLRQRLSGGRVEGGQIGPRWVRDPIAVTGAGIQWLDVKRRKNVRYGVTGGGHDSILVRLRGAKGSFPCL